MDKTALFKITYGLYLAAVEYEGERCGCIINTASQATDTPCRILVTMQKRNHTTELVMRKKSMTVSALAISCPTEVIRHFGFQSGRDTDKFADTAYRTDGEGNPYIAEHVTAYYSCRVMQSIDLDTHMLFICDVEEAENLSAEAALTYGDYRAAKNGKVSEMPVESEKKTVKKYVCPICHYVYDGDIPFGDLPDSYVCPICKQPKSIFQMIEE